MPFPNLLDSLGRHLAGLGELLHQADLGLLLILLVGISMSLSHLFALLANLLTPRQILVQLMLDGFVLGLALLLCSLVDMLLLGRFAPVPVHPSRFVDEMGIALVPGLFYVFVAAPYISDLIALGIWVMIHLNVVVLLHHHFGLAYAQALLLSTPGYALALVLVIGVFHQGWQTGYRRLADQFAP
jgi:hypothetical protein